MLNGIGAAAASGIPLDRQQSVDLRLGLCHRVRQITVQALHTFHVMTRHTIMLGPFGYDKLCGEHINRLLVLIECGAP